MFVDWVWNVMTGFVCRKTWCTSYLTKHVYTLLCIYINFSKSVTSCAFYTLKQAQNSLNHTTRSLQTCLQCLQTRLVQTSQTPTACQCLEPIVQCAGSISLLATAGCGALLDLGHSHSTAHVGGAKGS